MREFSVTQKYFVCAVNEDGKISGFNTEKLVCLVAGALLDLQLEKCIILDKKTVTVIGRLPENRADLKPLYNFVNQGRPIKLEKVLEAYCGSMTDKRLSELMDAIGTSLESMGAAKTAKAGILGNKKSYIPKREVVDEVVVKLRLGLLGSGEIRERDAALAILLDRSKCLQKYVSKTERKEIRDRLMEITNAPAGKLIRQMIEYVEDMISTISALVVTVLNVM